jgi:hypothetical protein
MSEQARALIRELKTAAQDMNTDRVAQACDQLVALFVRGEAVSEEDATGAIKCLRQKRLFAQLERVAVSYLDHVRRTPMLRFYYAQALVDQDRPGAALEVLNRLLGEIDEGAPAAEEARALVGRVYKQAFVRPGPDAPAQGPEALRLAIAAYRQAWARATRDPRWPAVNVLALTVRAREEGISIPDGDDPRDMARKIVDEVTAVDAAERQTAVDEGREPKQRPWWFATALEASLALEAPEQEALVVEWGRRYLDCEAADAFELGSTLRQLTEIWRLQQHPNRVIASFLPLLEARLLRRKKGAQLDQPRGMIAALQGGWVPEAVWGQQRFQDFRWMKKAVGHSDSIGQVQDRSRRPVGTGFLMVGRDLRPDWGSDQVLITNHHVVSDPPGPIGIPPSRALVSLTTHEGPDRDDGIPVAEILWCDPTLDVAVLRLQRQPQRPRGLELGQTGGLEWRTDPRSRIFVIGHPLGGALAYSMYDNDLRSIERPTVYYRSPTESGSSGSPVFNPDFELIAIHRGHHIERQENRGSLMEAVCAAAAHAKDQAKKVSP